MKVPLDKLSSVGRILSGSNGATTLTIGDIALSVKAAQLSTRYQARVSFFFFYYKLINFKLVHSYNVKHLTCTIFRSSGLQNIYKLHIWKCSTFTIFTLLTKETKIHIP